MPTYDVRDPVDVFHVQRSVVRFAGMLGFSRRQCGELAIVASELTSNILKYGVRGTIEIESFSDEGGAGVRLVATDEGPAFRDLERALEDGCDEDGPIDPLTMLGRKGIGGGLGAVLRLSHSFRVEALAKGKRLHVARYLGRRLSGGIR